MLLWNVCNKGTYLGNKSDALSKIELENIENELNDKYSEVMCDKIQSEINSINSEDGGLNVGHFWKLKCKLSPRPNKPPTAMLDSNDNLQTEPDKTVNEAVNHYQNVVDDRVMDGDYKHIKKAREDLCTKRLELASKN